MGRIAILGRFEYEYEYRDAEYEYEKKADRRRRADAIRLQDAIWGDPDDQCAQATRNGRTIEKNAMARIMAPDGLNRNVRALASDFVVLVLSEAVLSETVLVLDGCLNLGDADR